MNEAESTTRLHLHVPTAIQGELFPTSDAQPVTRGYKGSVASRVAGITSVSYTHLHRGQRSGWNHSRPCR